MKYLDTHAHTNFTAYTDDLDQVIERANDAGVAITNVGTQFDTSKRGVELAEKHDNLYAIIGLHPIHTTRVHHDEAELGKGNPEFTSRGETFDIDAYRELAKSSDNVVGIGECGLDYYRNDPDTRDAQEDAFRAQIELAIELDLPLMLHVRPSENSMDAYYDVLEILRAYKKDAGDILRGNAHFFAGDTAVADTFLELGFDVSFTGVITFAKEYAKVIAHVPLDRMHAETDCPYVTPIPNRGKRNEPAYVVGVVEKIAEIKNMEIDEVAEQLRANAKRLWGISNK